MGYQPVLVMRDQGQRHRGGKLRVGSWAGFLAGEYLALGLEARGASGFDLSLSLTSALAAVSAFDRASAPFPHRTLTLYDGSFFWTSQSHAEPAVPSSVLYPSWKEGGRGGVLW